MKGEQLFTELMPVENKNGKKKILYYGDSPLTYTGLAHISYQIITALEDDFDITVCAINQFTEVPQGLKYKLFASQSPANDPLNQTLLTMLIEESRFDILFLAVDWNYVTPLNPIIEKKLKKEKFKIILYTPIDVEEIRKELVEQFLLYDYIVTYSEEGVRVLTKSLGKKYDKISYIECGVDSNTFHPLSLNKIRKERKKIFKIEDRDFLIINVSRNQWRKDLGRSMFVFKLWRDYLNSLDPKVKTKLYIHAADNDVGGNLGAVAYSLGIENDFLTLPGSIFEQGGVKPEFLNTLYNCADLLISTSIGEGWGLPITEAMCAKTPVLVPYNTAMIDLVKENRGFFAKSGGSQSEYFIYGSETSFMRPLVNVEDMLIQLKKIYDFKRGLVWTGEMLDIIENAYNFAHDLSWEKAGKLWQNFLKTI